MQSKRVIGIQSFCLRNFKTVESLIEKTQECGIENIEIFEGHCNVLDENTVGFVNKIKSEGIGIDSWFEGIPPELEQAKAFFKALKGFGCSVLVINDLPEDLSLASSLCREYGLKVALHNHGRKHAHGSVDALEKLFDQTDDEIGLCLDTAWMQDSGEDPIEVAKKFSSRLYGIHIKDFVFNRAGTHQDVPVGDGNLDLPLLFTTLDAVDFDGPLILEYEGNPDNPVPEIKKCVENIEKAMEKQNG
ncbi:MAG: sugar phosphate isomerase/epimerase [Spirochaetales bacterium]|nr:sugar phosphate isomerase/epimerase [Spirochaetales bacterium]